jgi:hypothetical protein
MTPWEFSEPHSFQFCAIMSDFIRLTSSRVLHCSHHSGLSYDTIVAGEVQSIDVDLTLSNTGSEDAIDLILTAENLAQP